MFSIATILITRAPDGALEVERLRGHPSDPAPSIAGRLDDGMGVLDFIEAFNPQARADVDVTIDLDDIGYTPGGD